VLRVEVQGQAVLVEVTSMLRTGSFLQFHTQLGILMMVNAKLQVEALRPIVMLLR
jgi:hypothetical protein